MKVELSFYFLFLLTTTHNCMTVWFSYMCRNVFNGLESSTEFCKPLHNVAFVL